MIAIMILLKVLSMVQKGKYYLKIAILLFFLADLEASMLRD